MLLALSGVWRLPVAGVVEVAGAGRALVGGAGALAGVIGVSPAGVYWRCRRRREPFGVWLALAGVVILVGAAENWFMSFGVILEAGYGACGVRRRQARHYVGWRRLCSLAPAGVWLRLSGACSKIRALLGVCLCLLVWRLLASEFGAVWRLLATTLCPTSSFPIPISERKHAAHNITSISSPHHHHRWSSTTIINTINIIINTLRLLSSVSSSSTRVINTHYPLNDSRFVNAGLRAANAAIVLLMLP
jgi:hypothetical protein